MIDIVNISVLVVFGICMAFIFSYSLIQLNLIINYLKSKKQPKKEETKLNDLPLVTVQLPIYNELYVVERLIDKICEFDYPKDKLEIQILDDSDDETVDIIKQKVKFYKNLDYDINHIRRTDRKGYKAGALKYGTSLCKGEFIAIFDADFLPQSDFLFKTLPYFNLKHVGVVQTRWGFINSNYSTLTALQSFALDAHFTIEQVGRNYSNHFINFNGTAGVWRKACIEDAGGWEADTLTEDLDLSYRAQLKGWRFIYLEDVVTPSELPIEMNALKQQQFRWTKGAAECTVKNLVRVLNSKAIDGVKPKTSTKIHAIFHLMNSSIFPIIFLMSLLTLPLILIKPLYPEYYYLIQIPGFFMISWLILAVFYWVSYTKNKTGNFISFLTHFIGFLSVSMGLSLHNSLAVFEGYIGKKTPFIRTPKFNIETTKNWAQNKYIVKKINPLTIFEGGMLIYLMYTLYVAITYRDFGMIPMLLFLIFGYSYVFFNSIIHLNKIKRKASFYSLKKIGQ